MLGMLGWVLWLVVDKSRAVSLVAVRSLNERESVLAYSGVGFGVAFWRASGCPQIELLSSSHGSVWGIGGWAHRNLIPHPPGDLRLFLCSRNLGQEIWLNDVTVVS